jgi:glycosyltransferase involved in cell wall biosynthesis
MIALPRVRSLLKRLRGGGLRELPADFSEADYLLANPDVARAVQVGGLASGAQHWLTSGRYENRRLRLGTPVPTDFDPEAYLQLNPDVADGVARGVYGSALEHFVLYGHDEGRLWRRNKSGRTRETGDKAASPEGSPRNFVHAESALGFDVASYLSVYADVSGHFGNDLPGIVDHWFHRGYAEGRIPFGLRPFATRKTGPEFFSKTNAINLFGPFEAFSGLGSSVRAYRTALLRAGFDVTSINMRFEAGRFETDPDVREGASASQEVKGKKLNIFHLNADMVQLFFQDGRRHLLDDSFNIGIWYWELAHFRSDWANVFGAFDEIWVASEFCRQAVASASPVPVVKMPLAIERPQEEQPLPRSHFGIHEEAFVFGCIFDVGSGIVRKNPQAAIEAFIKDFGNRSDVVLLLKHQSGGHAHGDLAALYDLVGDRKNIRFLGRDFSEQENLSFKRHLNCLVSPHRGEGFGLNLAEAMILGIPVIATGYSGNLDFMDETNSYLIDYRLVEVEEQFGPYLPGSLWAEPSVDDLARKMRAVFVDRAGAAERAAHARDRILKDYNLETFAGALKTRIEALELSKAGGAFTRSWGAGKHCAAAFQSRKVQVRP